jgi:thiol-disulfide isomerase/thioredoxin
MKFVLLFVLSLLPAALAQDASWQDLPLTNARTGETFSLADFAGQTVYVEPMATWCTNCRQQLGNVSDAKAQLGDEVAFIALSVETTLSADELARYAEDQGFDFTFAVMTPPLLRALAAAFGQSVTSPPSTPHFIISPDGTTSELLTGFSTPDEIVAAVQQ